MYVLSKNRMQIINLEHVTAMYLGADVTSIKVDFVTGRGSQIGKYVSDTYAKKALELLILAIGRRGEAFSMPTDEEIRELLGNQESKNHNIGGKKQKGHGGS